jgi:RHS repeat-associated protein
VGKVISRRDFLPFGEEIQSGIGGRNSAQGYFGVDSIRQKFTGYERDAETSLDYAKARMFGSSLGRFTSPDDFLNDTHVEDPQSWNLYVYVRNNPLRLVDPDGEVKRDANGNVITEERKDKDKLTKVIDGKTYYLSPIKIDGKTVVWEAKKVWITADNGKKIKAYQAVGEMQLLENKKDDKGKSTESLTSVEQSKEIIDKAGDSTILPFSNKTNCHGTTFASGQVTIENDQVSALMKGDKFRPLGNSETPQVNDVGIYSDPGYINDHSVRVNSTNEKGVVDVVSKGGIQRQRIDSPGPGSGTAWSNPAAKLQYFTQRPKPKN